MKSCEDSAEGKKMIAACFADLRLLFGNVRQNARLAKFTLRGRNMVDGQRKLSCLAHNIEKLWYHEYANWVSSWARPMPFRKRPAPAGADVMGRRHEARRSETMMNDFDPSSAEHNRLPRNGVLLQRR